MEEVSKKKLEGIIPMDKPHRISALFRFSLEQYEKIKLGLEPQMMEDKWYVYLEDNIVHCHRSWTGYEVYRAEIKPGNDGTNENAAYVITEIFAERNEEKYTCTDDKKDIESFAQVIAWLVLDTDIKNIGYSG
jgi:hypothetical protein